VLLVIVLVERGLLALARLLPVADLDPAGAVC
jgi:hypothetical protein